MVVDIQSCSARPHGAFPALWDTCMCCTGGGFQHRGAVVLGAVMQVMSPGKPSWCLLSPPERPSLLPTRVNQTGQPPDTMGHMHGVFIAV